MTNRSDSNSNSNHRPLPPRDDRETLSALFDGELSGDATRFALKRLDHDAGWRETCGRWQLIGDALRGEAMAAAPAGFATGVMRALAEEGRATVAASAPAATGAPVARASRRRWIGGAALAASVAVAAVLVVRPFSGSSTASPEGQLASDVVAPIPAVTAAAPSTEPVVPAAVKQVVSDTTSRIAEAQAPRAVSRRSANRTRPVVRPTRAPATSVQTIADEPAAALAAATAPVSTGQPFHPPVDDIVTRPWPRPVLSDDAAGALTVGFGATSSASPSLYPFEPRLPDNQTIRSTSSDPQRTDPQR